MTVAQRINGKGNQSVRLQVSLGMIYEDVSTLLFVFGEKCYVSCL